MCRNKHAEDLSGADPNAVRSFYSSVQRQLDAKFSIVTRRLEPQKLQVSTMSTAEVRASLAFTLVCAVDAATTTTVASTDGGGWPWWAWFLLMLGIFFFVVVIVSNNFNYVERAMKGVAGVLKKSPIESVSDAAIRFLENQKKKQPYPTLQNNKITYTSPPTHQVALQPPIVTMRPVAPSFSMPTATAPVPQQVATRTMPYPMATASTFPMATTTPRVF